MTANKTLIASILGLTFALAAPAFADNGENNKGSNEQTTQASPSERRAAIRENAKKTLDELYAKHPDLQAKLEKASGYAVFATGGVQIIFAGAGSGSGVAVRHGKETFMGMGQVKAGLGLGAKSSRLVLVFTTDAAFDKFVKSGWSFGGDATAAAKAKGSGAAFEGATPVAEGVYAFQFTESGLTAEATVAGTKYYVDKKLNSHK